MDRVDVTIVGAGVIGLGIAAQLSSRSTSCIILEKNAAFGQETSSRNSEVIHSGIYYPSGTLKATLCVRGNPLLYEFCANNHIKHERCGKIVVSQNAPEDEELDRLYSNGTTNGVQGLERIGQSKLRALEPGITARSGLFVPSTGIIDTHALMQTLAAHASAQGTMIAYNSEVCAINRSAQGFTVTTKQDDYQFETKILINAAGLQADVVASLVGLDSKSLGYTLHYCKGNYFRTSKQMHVNHLIYPVPSASVRSLGIHLTKDLVHAYRFGPDAHYIDGLDYSIDENERDTFAAAIQQYLPGIQAHDLYPDTAGIRPKLQGPSDGFKDFVIKEESEHGYPHFINLIGIESPGLTSVLAIAELVKSFI